MDGLTPEGVEHYRRAFRRRTFAREQLTFDAVDALALELDDFVGSIRAAHAPRVSGEAGRDALAVAEQILDRIDAHCWDASLDGPIGPLALPHQRLLSAA